MHDMGIIYAFIGEKEQAKKEETRKQNWKINHLIRVYASFYHNICCDLN
jgi:uncharacterized membrane protein